MKIVLFVGIFLVLFSGTVLFLVGQSAKKSLDKRKEMLETEGNVLALIESTDSDGDTVYSPRVEFTSRSDRKIVFESEVAFSPSPYQVGGKIKVRYNPNRPEEAVVSDFASTLFIPLFIVAIALVFFIVGIAVAYFAWKGR